MYIKKQYNKEKETIRKSIIDACLCINNLPKKTIRIPVFASQMLSNPHGLDKKCSCGKIFIILLCYTENISYPKDSEELSELYYRHNLLIDDISSIVLCKNINAFSEEKLTEREKILYGKETTIRKYVQHEGWKGFNSKNEPIFVTLYNLEKVAYINKSENMSVMIVENPAVFMGITEKCKIKNFPLICTYGQVKIAGLVLLNLLVQAGYKLYYSGDLDPEGIQIADKLKRRYKDNMTLVGFDKETYEKYNKIISIVKENLFNNNIYPKGGLDLLLNDNEDFNNKKEQNGFIEYIINKEGVLIYG